jgi:intergrase/recombinase
VKATAIRITPHDLCRSAIRNMVRAGVPEKVAMEIAGRKTRSIFDRYHIVSTEQMKDAFAPVARWKRERAAKKRKVVKLG